MSKKFETHETEFGISVLADCMDYMATMADKSVDLCLTDPPYGIGESAKRNNTRGKAYKGSNAYACATDYGDDNWDSVPLLSTQRDAIFRLSKNQIIFGGNYFELCPSPCWIVWDKDNGNSDFADCELAWTSFKTAVRKFKWKWQGMLQENMKEKEKRYHLTQKPVALFQWCLTNYSKEDQTVLDPFAGSFTTAIACIRTGRKYICIEKERKYFDIGVKRIEAELEQTDFLR